MYFGAEHLIGFFMLVPSAQWYSYLLGDRKKNNLCYMSKRNTFSLRCGYSGNKALQLPPYLGKVCSAKEALCSNPHK